MRKFVLPLILSAITPFAAKAVMACPDPVRVTQPDGTEITLYLHGDESSNFTTTADGYTVVKSAVSGAWEYARVTDARLETTGITAHEPTQRSTADLNCLMSLPRMLRPQATQQQAQMRRAAEQLQQTASQAPAKAAAYDYTKFRGLVILVEYDQCPFSRTDIHDVFNRMVNEPGFSGFESTTLPGKKIEYTGSVRDYYYENSLGIFDPQFDVVGPVKVPYTKDYVNQTDNIQTLIKAALRAADTQLDYSIYDTDGDGEVDMVYFVFSGPGSNYSGNNTKLLWPHAHVVSNQFTLDGVRFRRYACSTEFYGPEANRNIDGIGTICHEFSHVLGLPDLYDTDYATNGQSIHPRNWSVMANGNYLNSSKTPCAYSAYERYAIGFAKPEVITSTGKRELDYIGSTGASYRIDSPMANEYFLLENRQKIRWDQYLPGEGLLAFRVDSTNTTVWEMNTINDNASRNYYELIRATPGATDCDGDPFPGSGGVTTLTPQSFTGMHTDFVLTDITLTDDGKITFSVDRDPSPTLVEGFELMPLTNSDTTATGTFTNWEMANGARICPIAETYGTGTQALGLIRKATATTGAIEHTVQSISLNAITPAEYGTYASMLQVSYKAPGNTGWIPVKNQDGNTSTTILQNENKQLTFKIPDVKGASYRISLTSGDRTTPLLIDNFALQCKAEQSTGIDQVTDDTTDRLQVSVNGNQLRAVTTAGKQVTAYDLTGRTVSTAEANADGVARLTLPLRGAYIVTDGIHTVKVAL